VNDGEAALEFLRRTYVDLVLLDLIMPVMDGFETLERLRQGGFARDIPVVVLTSKELSQAENERLTKLANGIIRKDGEVEVRLAEIFDRYFGDETAGSPPRVGA
jgi:CheY-like chemotaxis protein